MGRACSIFTVCYLKPRLNVAISTHTAAKCIHNALGAVLRALIYESHILHRHFERGLQTLTNNAQRVNPDCDRLSE